MVDFDDIRKSMTYEEMLVYRELPPEKWRAHWAAADDNERARMCVSMHDTTTLTRREKQYGELLARALSAEHRIAALEAELQRATAERAVALAQVKMLGTGRGWALSDLEKAVTERDEQRARAERAEAALSESIERERHTKKVLASAERDYRHRIADRERERDEARAALERSKGR